MDGKIISTESRASPPGWGRAPAWLLALAAVLPCDAPFAETMPAAARPSILSYRYEPVASCNVVIDRATRLMWQRCAIGQTWDGATCVGRPARLDWTQAMAYRADHCGFADWRLPDVGDLEGLVVEGGIPSIDAVVFPNTPPASFWSSTPSNTMQRQAWLVSFAKGGAEPVFKDSRFHVRLVRELR